MRDLLIRGIGLLLWIIGLGFGAMSFWSAVKVGNEYGKKDNLTVILFGLITFILFIGFWAAGFYLFLKGFRSI